MNSKTRVNIDLSDSFYDSIALNDSDAAMIKLIKQTFVSVRFVKLFLRFVV